MTPLQVLALIREREVRAVDLRFLDLPGRWHHYTIPAEELDELTFEDGKGFDGSNLRGWQAINESDMLLVPQADTAFIDPFCQPATLVLICAIQDPLTREDYTRDPRFVARKAVDYMRHQGVADVAHFGPELEFCIFDDVRFDQTTHSGYYYLDSAEAAWNTGREERPNLGHKLRPREGYTPCPPNDSLHDLRTEMMLTMAECGLRAEAHHHEPASGGQCEISMRFGPLIEAADNVLKYKYVVKNVARKHRRSATFMPKPLFGEGGNGMQVHLSLWKNDKNLFAGSGYANLSETALFAIGGLLRHAPALCALTNPTTNSYKRLVPRTDAPVTLAYSRRNRSAAIRIPVTSAASAGRRLEYRCPDGSSNPYLAFAALLMAMLDGIKNKIHPGEALDKDIYDLPPEVRAELPQTPASLEEALDALRRDREFLLQGGVFTEDVLDTWLRFKLERDIDAMRLRPHPYEFSLYYDS